MLLNLVALGSIEFGDGLRGAHTDKLARQDGPGFAVESTTKFAEDPQVKHYGKRGAGERLRAGMIFTIEPMVNEGTYAVEVDPADKWTVRTADRGLSAQFEHTVLVTKKGCDVLTARSSVLRNSENRVALFV